MPYFSLALGAPDPGVVVVLEVWFQLAEVAPGPGEFSLAEWVLPIGWGLDCASGQPKIFNHRAAQDVL